MSTNIPNEEPEELTRNPVLQPGYNFGSITDKISHLALTKRTPLGWFIGFGISFMLLMLLLYGLGMLFLKGTGVWGNNNPVGWAFDIINFVWWIGIGHAGTRSEEHTSE